MIVLRRSVVAIDGRPCISQRFAIDWVLIGNNGNTFHDSRERNENFWAFGQPVLAVADGEASEVVDGIPDNLPGKKTIARYLSPFPPCSTDLAGRMSDVDQFAAGTRVTAKTRTSRLLGKLKLRTTFSGSSVNEYAFAWKVRASFEPSAVRR